MKIEKDIEIPTKHARTKYPFAEMEVGDSIYSDVISASTSARGWGYRNNKKFTTRREGNGYRTWRIE